MMEKLIKKLNNRKGFTLIELIVVIAIIGILAAILIPQFSGFTDRAKSTQAIVLAKQIATAADGLIAEGKTTYSANGTANATTLTNAEIVSIAGPDTTSSAISNGAIQNNHFTFSYTDTVSGFTATRTSDGAITAKK